MVLKSTSSKNVDYYDQFAEQYDLFFSDLERNMEEEGQWLDEVLRSEHVRTVLDASCGTGRQAIPLAQRGYRVTASDPSEGMLQQARAKADAKNVEIALLQAGFSDLSRCAPGPYDAVLVLGNSICNLSRGDDILRALTALRRCCRPNGICLVGTKDFDTLKRERPRFHGHRVVDSNGERAILFEVWDYADPKLLCQAFLLRGSDARWRVQSSHTEEYMLGGDEFAGYALRAGFGGIDRLAHPSELIYALR